MDIKKNKRRYSSLFYLYLIGAILFIIFGPEPKTSGGRPSTRNKACYSNIRIIQGAVEMYNNSSSVSMNDLSIDDLIRGRCLEEEPIAPDVYCSYRGNDLNKESSVYCTFHGDLQGLTAGTYDGIDTMSRNYKIKNYIDNLFKRIPYSILWPLFAHPDGLTTYVK